VLVVLLRRNILVWWNVAFPETCVRYFAVYSRILAGEIPAQGLQNLLHHHTICAGPLCTQIFQHSYGSYEFYTRDNPANTDVTFRYARRGFPKAILVGLVDAAQGVYVCVCEFCLLCPYGVSTCVTKSTCQGLYCCGFAYSSQHILEAKPKTVMAWWVTQHVLTASEEMGLCSSPP